MTTTTQPAGRMTLKGARLAFPQLFEAATVNGEGKPRFSANFLIPKDHPQIAEIKAKMLAVAKDKWGAKGESIFKTIEEDRKTALQNGDRKSNYDGYPGNLYISAAAQEGARPTIVDGDRNALTAKDGKPYAGCYVNGLLEFWAQDNKFGKRINAQLRGVQFVRDGDAFSAGRPADSDEFEPVAEGADAAEFA